MSCQPLVFSACPSVWPRPACEICSGAQQLNLELLSNNGHCRHCGDAFTGTAQISAGMQGKQASCIAQQRVCSMTVQHTCGMGIIQRLLLDRCSLKRLSDEPLQYSCCHTWAQHGCSRPFYPSGNSAYVSLPLS